MKRAIHPRRSAGGRRIRVLGRELENAVGSRTQSWVLVSDGSIAEVDRTNRDRDLSQSSRSAGCKPRGIGRARHDLASKEPTRIVVNDRVEGALGEPVREFGLRGRIHNRNLGSLPTWQHTGVNAVRRKAFWNAQPRAPNRVRGDASWWSRSTRRHVFAERQTRVREAVGGRWNRPGVSRARHRTSEIGVDSGKARPAPR